MEFGVLFDLDGVLVDTEGQYSDFWGAAAAKYLPEVKGFANMIKGQTTQAILSHYPAEVIPSLTEIYADFEANLDCPLMDGAEELIRDLHSHGVKICIVTASSDIKLRNVLRKHPLFEELFDFIISGDQIKKSKPDPECYLTAARKIDVPAARCVVFEDSVNGLNAGLNAGMKVVGVTTTHPNTVVGPLCHMMIPHLSLCDYGNLKRLAGL